MGFLDFFSFFRIDKDDSIVNEEDIEIDDTITFISCDGLDGGDTLEEPSFVKD